MTKPFTSCFAQHLTEYVALRQRLGLKFERQSAILYWFDRYLSETAYQGPLTQELVMTFVTHTPAISAGERANRYSTIEHFSRYYAAYVPDTPVLDPKALTAKCHRPTPYIFTDQELAQLLHLAKTLAYNPIRRVTLHAMVALAATTGMRRGEVIRLDRADVDLTTGVLHIRQAKFFKERLVPVHPTTLAVLQEYARVRDVTYLHPASPAFFLSMDRIRFAKHTWTMAFRGLLTAMGFSWTEPHPTLHSLRHTFAVRRLETWYAEGRDVQALLPSLATYLGHAHYSDTAYYITATPRLMALAAERADTAWLAQAGTEVPE
jgi:integrase